ncbi:hypothetical protein LIPSTDRAFT_277618 [Lipomyces starkeyi NRRL Y-11557]|uniref:Uncharacterized protein n=1 Tax=Lipomyces starkeyi NRRL Y-11557 TaxID=675824 RepID=A0A1E3Q7A2_LIPST|nr:hypothetical protein LIPSTDRAFT_277618 [Lipomyces starkeyi NRRL Y-11557]
MNAPVCSIPSSRKPALSMAHRAEHTQELPEVFQECCGLDRFMKMIKVVGSAADSEDQANSLEELKCDFPAVAVDNFLRQW